MITTRIQIESYLAEYVRGKYYDETVGTVRFVVIFAPDILGQVGFDLYSGGNHSNNIPF